MPQFMPFLPFLRTTTAASRSEARRHRVLRCTLAAWALAAGSACADDAVLDPGFGGGGRVTASFDVTSPFTDKAVRILKIPAGGYYIVGSATGGTSRLIAILRISEAGVPVASFGTSGKVTIDACLSEVNDAALDGEGRILVAGTTLPACGTTGAADGRLVRVTAAGALDTSFSSDGIVNVRYTTTSDGEERALAIVVRASGEILVGGSVDGDGAGTALVDNAAFRRITSAGADLSVVTSGSTGAPQSIVAGIALDDDSVVWAIARDAPLAGQGSGYFWKLTPTLANDGSFGNLGLRALTATGGEEGCGSARTHVPRAIVPFGNTLKMFGFSSAAGEPNRSWYASVDNANGAPNYAIRCLTMAGQGSISIKAASHTPSGLPRSIALAGICGSFPADQCVMRAARSSPGSDRLIRLDPDFIGGDAFLVMYASSAQPIGGDGNAVRMEGDGRIVVAGSRWWNFNGDSDFALARFRRPDALMRSGFEAE